MVGNFGAIHVEITRANFQPSSFNGVGGGGDRWTHKGHQAFLNRSFTQHFKTPPFALLRRDNLKLT